MKFIHSADIHLGSTFSYISDNDKKNKLQSALRRSFSYMVAYAKDNSIDAILLSGDIFDKDRVNKSDKEFFYSVIKGNEDIKFYYIRGNHDKSSSTLDGASNFFTFTYENKIKTYVDDINKISISAYEISDSNNNDLYNMEPLNSTYFNIMMLHGDVSSVGKDSIVLNKLTNKNINYFALGHIHLRSNNKLKANSIYSYPGCLMGRGFDETGDKGFLVLDTDNNSTEFIKNDTYHFEKKEYDVTDFSDNYSLIKHLKEDLLNDEKVLLQIVLKGKINFDLDNNLIIESIKNGFFYVVIKNSTTLAFVKPTEISPNSLKGVFVDMVSNNKDLDENLKEEILRYGISKIEKKEV